MFFGDAGTAAADCPKKVELEVETLDKWSLRAGKKGGRSELWVESIRFDLLDGKLLNVLAVAGLRGPTRRHP